MKKKKLNIGGEMEVLRYRVNCNAMTTCTNSSGVKPDLGLKNKLLNQYNWKAVEREDSQNEREKEKVPTAILPRPIFARFTRSSFPILSPSDACHAG